MTNNLVSRFRVKKLSPKQRLPVYKASQLPDLLDDAIKLNRSVPIIETGVEKEEEEEVRMMMMMMKGFSLAHTYLQA